MNKDNALFVAGILFGIGAIVHLMRLMFHFNLIIARHEIPVWVSIPGFVVAFAMATWMFGARAKPGKKTR